MYTCEHDDQVRGVTTSSSIELALCARARASVLRTTRVPNERPGKCACLASWSISWPWRAQHIGENKMEPFSSPSLLICFYLVIFNQTFARFSGSSAHHSLSRNSPLLARRVQLNFSSFLRHLSSLYSSLWHFSSSLVQRFHWQWQK